MFWRTRISAVVRNGSMRGPRGGTATRTKLTPQAWTCSWESSLSAPQISSRAYRVGPNEGQPTLGEKAKSSINEGEQPHPAVHLRMAGSYSYTSWKDAGKDAGQTESSAHMRSYGVFKESEEEDIEMLQNNYTVPALARALREREVALQRAATLMEQGDTKALKLLLNPFTSANVLRRRYRDHKLDLSTGFHRSSLVLLQRYLHRMPREVFHSAERRASVVIPLCNVNGVASILFERRSRLVSTHKQEVCFPGGMVDEGVDASIIQTSLREMEEEIGITTELTEVLGILRCKWSEVAGMTGVAVTPVIGYIGELTELKITPNYDEVEQVFTIPLRDLLDETKWTHKSFSTPVFHGGPFAIWGLTAYLLHLFLKDVVRECSTELQSRN
jgi:nudix motif 8